MGHAHPSFGAFALGEFADANGIAQISIFENISPSFLLTRISSDAGKCGWVKLRSSLRAKRSNPGERRAPYGILDRHVAIARRKAGVF
jgi:hypothetical protein